MMKNNFFIFIISLILFSGCKYFKNDSLEDSPIIPQPSTLVFNNGFFNLTAKTGLKTNLENKKQPLQWFEDIAIQQLTDKSENTINLSLDTDSTDYNSSESYSLSITEDSIIIKGPTEVALFYGVQNVLQLYNEYGKRIPAMSITDSPRFPVRSLLLDASNHCLTLDFMKKQIDMMSYYKFNRLQWHIGCVKSWGIHLAKGFINPYEICYTKTEIKEIVNYAKKKFITIIPSIDLSYFSNNYAESVGAKYDNEDSRYTKKLLSNIIALFPSEYIYIGNGEADNSHGTYCEGCRNKVDEELVLDEKDIRIKVLQDIESFLKSKGKKLIAWEESLRLGLSKDATMVAWHDSDDGFRASLRGYDVILSPASFSTFSYYQDNPITSPKSMSGFLPIDKVYNFNPRPSNISQEALQHIKGIQMNMWTQYIEKEEDIEYYLYPRLLAAAEMAWTTPTRKSYLNFKKRVLMATKTLKQKSYNCFDLLSESSIRPESINPVTSIVKNKKVKYLTAFSEAFPANGIISLTDGVRGGWHYKDDSRWQGFIGNGMSVLMDLEKETDIKQISTTFISDTDANVYLPKKVYIYVSNDGDSFELLDSIVKNPTKEKNYNLEDYIWSGNVKTRFVRYEAQPINEPENWIFTDEIIIQ